MENQNNKLKEEEKIIYIINKLKQQTNNQKRKNEFDDILNQLTNNFNNK